MHVKLLTDLRGPVGSIQKVYLKLARWYVIKSTEGYYCDRSSLENSDRILYEESPGFFKKDKGLPDGYTFVGYDICTEVIVSNNNACKHLLEKEH